MRINREGAIHFADASIHIWEENVNEGEFKNVVFKRIVQTLNRLGWTCVVPEDLVKKYSQSFARRSRYCTKGDLKGELRVCGRHIEFQMWQSINTPTRPDHGGKYEFGKEKIMPYLLRLEMERTRNRIRNYLLYVFDGYTFKPPKIASANPDPLAYFNDRWDSDLDKKRGRHRFDRGLDGWPTESEIGRWNRKDGDGNTLIHGAIRWSRDDKGRLQRGRVYGGINGMWLFVYGSGPHDYTHRHASEFFCYVDEMTPRKANAGLRRKRLEQELKVSIAQMNFKRAELLKNLLFPEGQVYIIYSTERHTYHGPGYCGYTSDTAKAGRFSEKEAREIAHETDKIVPLSEAAA